MQAALLALPFFVLATGCRKTPDDSTADKPVVNVQVEHAERGPITAQIVGEATLTPVAQAAIQARVTAPVKAFYVVRGSHVKAGQLLAVLEHGDLAAAALDNQGALTAARGTYTLATRQQVPQQQTQARLDLEQAKAALDLQQSILAARTSLLAEGAIPGRDVDTQRANVQQAQAAYELAKQRAQTTESIGNQASLQSAEGLLTSARGKYLGAEAQLGYTSLRSPIAGVVTERQLFPGETAQAGTALVTVMDTSVMIARLHLPERQAQQLALGAAATLTVPGSDQPVPAKVSLISPALDAGSTTVEVWLRARNPNGTLKPGSSVHAVIEAGTVEGAVLVPTEAIERSSEDGRPMVMVLAADGSAHRRSITIGVQTPAMTQVTTGLNAGDAVIVQGGHGLDEGAQVKVVAAGEPEAGEPGVAAKPDDAKAKPNEPKPQDAKARP
jgi:HlyD family secretion protein